MSFLIPLLPSLISAGAGIFGSLRENKLQKRAEKRGTNVQRIPQFSPDQQQVADLINSILTGQGQQPTGGLLGETFGEEGFKAFSEPAIRAFEERIAPGIAERFSGTGAGAQKSSAFQQALAGAGSDLARNLGELRSQQRQTALSGLLNQYLQPRENVLYQPRQPSGLSKGLGALGGAGASNIVEMLTSILQDKYGSRPTIGRGEII